MKSQSLIQPTLLACKLEKETLIDFLEEYVSFGIDDINESIQVYNFISALKYPIEHGIYINFEIIVHAITVHLVNCRCANELQRELDEDKFFATELTLTRIELFELMLERTLDTPFS